LGSVAKILKLLSVSAFAFSTNQLAKLSVASFSHQMQQDSHGEVMDSGLDLILEINKSKLWLT